MRSFSNKQFGDGSIYGGRELQKNFHHAKVYKKSQEKPKYYFVSFADNLLRDQINFCQGR